jgi:predicted amidohydrolase
VTRAGPVPPFCLPRRLPPEPAGDEEQVLTCRVDPQVVDEVRNRFPALSDRRIDLPAGAAST